MTGGAASRDAWFWILVGGLVAGSAAPATAQVMAAQVGVPESSVQGLSVVEAAELSEATRSAGIVALVTERVATTLGRSVSDTRVEITGPAPVGVDSVDVAQGSGRWIVTFFVDESRVRRFARSGSVGPVPVAARPIARGTTLGPEDVSVEERLTWDDDDQPPTDPIGLVTQRAISAGQPLIEPAVREPYLVRGGDQVRAVLEHSGVVMTLRAEALGTARNGDKVRVKLPSGVRMDGTVVGLGRVELNGGGRR